MSERHMIAYDLPPGRFNFRAAGIALRDGHVLIHRSTADDFWALPGGRVEWGESTRSTIAREMDEELGVSVAVGDLVMVLENFFAYAGQQVHELAYYFRMTLPDEFPFRTDGLVCHRCEDGGADLEFKWVPITGPALAKHALVPAILRDRLSVTASALQHLVYDERAETVL